MYVVKKLFIFFGFDDFVWVVWMDGLDFVCLDGWMVFVGWVLFGWMVCLDGWFGFCLFDGLDGWFGFNALCNAELFLMHCLMHCLMQSCF